MKKLKNIQTKEDKSKATIRYQIDEYDNWETAEILPRAGKATGGTSKLCHRLSNQLNSN